MAYYLFIVWLLSINRHQWYIMGSFSYLYCVLITSTELFLANRFVIILHHTHWMYVMHWYLLVIVTSCPVYLLLSYLILAGCVCQSIPGGSMADCLLICALQYINTRGVPQVIYTESAQVNCVIITRPRYSCCNQFNTVKTSPWPTLTHWGGDKMADISQTTFFNVFSWKKMYEFRLKFHWSLFLRVKLKITQYWLR